MKIEFFYQKIFRYRRVITMIFLSGFLGFESYGQNFTRNSGIPFVRNFSPEEYNGHEQNYSILQDKKGMMYFANFAGILQYDASVWNKIPTQSGMRVLSLCMNDKGTIFTAGLFDFGYLKKDNLNQLKYVSLVDSTKDKIQIGEIFGVHCIGEKTYFISESKLYLWENKTTSEIPFTGKAKSSFVINNKLYIFFERNLNKESLTENGLTIFVDGKIERIKDNSNAQIIDLKTMILTDIQDEIILGTTSQGLFILKNNTIQEFECDVNSFIKKNSLTCGTKGADSKYFFATLTGGLVISNDKGKIVQILNKFSGLQDESLSAVFQDENLSLWIASGAGISKVQLNSDLTYLTNQFNSYQGKVQDITDYEGKIYVATDNGLYFLGNNSFENIQGLNVACWDLLKVGNKLFVATSKGVFEVEAGRAKITECTDFSFCLYSPTSDAGKLYVGMNQKLAILTNKNQKWILSETISGFGGDIQKIGSSDNDNLILEIEPGKPEVYSLSEKMIKSFDFSENFISIHINSDNEKIFFATELGLYIPDKSFKKLISFNLLESDTSSYKMWIFHYYKLPDGNFITTDGEQKILVYL